MKALSYFILFTHIWFLPISTYCQASQTFSRQDMYLKVLLDQQLLTQKGSCAQALDDFLSTVRELFSEMRISLVNDLTTNAQDGSSSSEGLFIRLRCTSLSLVDAQLSVQELEPNGTEKSYAEHKNPIILRWVKSPDGFNAEDLIRFQKFVDSHFGLGVLAPKPSRGDSESLLYGSDLSTVKSEPSPDNRSAFYEKWWFWGLVAAAGSATGYIIYQNSQNNGATMLFR